MNSENKICFIDGQNFYLGTKKIEGLEIDLFKLRIYLKNKYKINKAYYFLGFHQKENQKFYQKTKDAGFILKFKEQKEKNISQKKGNIDSDLIFHAMKNWGLDKELSEIFIISGDGDFKILVDFLIEQKKFGKIFFPSRKFRSSLYKELPIGPYDYIKNFYKNIKKELLKH